MERSLSQLLGRELLNGVDAAARANRGVVPDGTAYDT